MNPKALDRTDYIKLALKLMDHLDPTALLKQWENEYLDINEKFHPYLLFTIDGLIKEYEQSTPGKPTNLTDNDFGSVPSQERKIRTLHIKRKVVFDRWLGFNLSHKMKPIIKRYVEVYHPYDFSWSDNFDLYLEEIRQQYIKLYKEKIKVDAITFSQRLKDFIHSLDQEKKSLLKVSEKDKEATNEEERIQQATFESRILIEFLKMAFSKELSGEEDRNISITLEKMEWLGTQKELAELLIMLKERRWIRQFRNTTIKACFTRSNSIQQVLKPGQQKGKYYDNYPQVFTENYLQKFHGIKENPKPK